MRTISASRIVDAEPRGPEKESPRIIRSQGARPVESGIAIPTRILRSERTHRSSTSYHIVGVPKAPSISEVDAPGEDDPAESQEPVDGAALREEIRLELEKEYAQKLDDARRDGYSAGFAASEQAHAAKIEEAAVRLDDTGRRLNEAWSGMMRSAEPMLAELAFRMAEGIMEFPIPGETRKVSVRTLSDALDRLANHAPVELLMHPVDVMSLQESGVSDQLSSTHAGLRIIGDVSVAAGDWEARCSAAVIRNVANELLDDLRERMQVKRLGEEGSE